MKKLAKIFAVVLTLALMLTGITLVASAEGETLKATKADGTTTQNFTDLQEAIDFAEEGGTVKLLSDYVATGAVTIPYSLKIDLNNNRRLHMQTYTMSITGGTITITNGRLARKDGQVTDYFMKVSGASTVVKLEKVDVVECASFAQLTGGATLNATQNYNNSTAWTVNRYVFHITNSFVNLEYVNIVEK